MTASIPCSRPVRALALLATAAPLGLLFGCQEAGRDTGAADTGEASAVEDQRAAEPSGGSPAGLSPSDAAGPKAMSADVSAPTDPAVTLNSGEDWSDSLSLTLSLSATDDTAVTAVCVSSTTTCTSWSTFTASRAYSAPAGSGLKTVYVKFKDAAGNVSAQVSDTITVDLADPIDGSLVATPSSGTVDLEIADATDAESGITGYKIVRALRAAPASCATGTVVYEGPATTATDTGLTDGLTYGYRACATDLAGNVSAGATTTARPAPEYDAPTGGSVVINSGATWTNRARVTLALAATDPSSVTKVCVSNGDTCTSWLPYTGTRSWTLSSGMGPRTVSVWFRDAYGNATTTAVTDEINLDTTRPSDGTASATGGDASAALTWQGYDDSLSGVASYKVVYARGTRAPSTCATGTVGYAGSDTSATLSGLTNGTTYALRVCAIDLAGNLSKGATTTVRPAPEFTPPTGSISLNAGAAYAGSERLTVSLSASDPSGVGWVCLSTTSTCTAWSLYGATKSLTVAKGTGTRTVNAWFKDVYGNATESPVSDSIELDQTKPTDGAINAEASGGAAANLSWNGFADAHSGVASYKAVYARSSSAPSSCATGTSGYSGSESSALVTGLLPSSTYAFRVCARDTAGNLSAGVTGTITTAADGSAPTSPSLEIAGGDAYTHSATLDLALSAEDNGTVTDMCLSESAGSCADWTAFATSSTYTVTEGDGDYVLYSWFRDEVGNLSAVTSDSVIVDTEVPMAGEMMATATSATDAEIEWWDFDDTLSGIATYRLVYRNDGLAPSDCEDGVTAYEGAGLSTTLEGLTSNTAYGLRLCAWDAAGNETLGATATLSLIDESPPSGGSVVINAGDSATAVDLVTLSLSATDPSGVAEVCVSESASACSAWESYDENLTYTLSGVEGSEAVYVWFRDSLGNETASPVSDSITYDASAPSDGSFLATAGNASAGLAWGGFVDTVTGIDHYVVVSDEGSAPADCESGTVAYSGSGASTTVVGLTNGTTVGFRICAVDHAGNTSAGLTQTLIPAPEFDGPTDGQIELNGGATATGDTVVSVSLEATDQSELGAYCLSTSGGACNAWVDWSVPATITLSGADGMKTVYAWFRDIYGNTSASAAAASILLDRVAPSGGAASVSAAGDNAATLSWSGFNDSASGIGGYVAVYAQGSTAPATCDSGTEAYSGTDNSTVVSGLSAQQTYSFRVCAVDTVGNMNSGVTTSITTVDSTAPGPNTVSIAAGAIATKTTGVTLTLSSTDEIGTTHMCVSNTTTCTTWLAYATTKSWTLTTGAGTKTVYVSFKDAAGNISAATTDTVIVDATVPTNGTVTGSASGGVGTLSWSGFADPGSGIASYKVVYSTGASAPSTCATGTLLGTSTGTTITHSGMTVGTTYRYRVCAIDNAGNISTGATRNVVGA